MRLQVGEPFKDYGLVVQITQDLDTDEFWIVADGHDEAINVTKEIEQL